MENTLKHLCGIETAAPLHTHHAEVVSPHPIGCSLEIQFFFLFGADIKMNHMSDCDLMAIV